MSSSWTQKTEVDDCVSLRFFFPPYILSLSAKPFVAGVAVAKATHRLGVRGRGISLDVQQKMCDFASKVGMKMCGQGTAPL